MFRNIIEAKAAEARTLGLIDNELVASRALLALGKLEDEGKFKDITEENKDLGEFLGTLIMVSRKRINGLQDFGKKLEGNTTEGRLRKYIFNNPNRLITKEELIEAAYCGRENIPESARNVLGIMVKRTRESFRDKGEIVNIRGEGYKFIKKA